MDFHLAPHVSYGLVGRRAVMLDLLADRYLLLGPEVADVLTALGRCRSVFSVAVLEKLLARGLLLPGPGATVGPVGQPCPLGSALEADLSGGGVSAFEALRRSIGALITMRALGLAPLIARSRTVRARAARRTELVEDPDRAAFFARGFAEARISVPMPRLCVPDSLALAGSLWARGLAAEVYFGVQLDPLLAHAWVQQGPLVLSDPLNIAADYRPVFRL